MLAILLLVSATVVACGKKGPPLAPLRRVPAAATGLAAERYASDVFVRLTVPSTNIEGVGAADLSRMEVYAITAARLLAAADVQTAAFRDRATLIASESVRRPLPPPPPPEPGMPPLPALPLEPGLDQGAEIVVREGLTPSAADVVPLADAASLVQPDGDSTAWVGPLMAPDASSGPRRYYVAVGVTPNGRYGAASAPVSVPLAAPTGAPSELRIGYDEQAFTVRWSPPGDARVAEAPSPPNGLLPSRPLTPPLPATRYDVYAVDRGAPNAAPVQVPDAINDEPLTAPELKIMGVTFGKERCFAVRSVDVRGGSTIRGPLSVPACAIPVDTFAPAAPRNLQAVSGAGTISLIWEANTEADLAGYLVLRGDVPGDTLTPLTSAPIREPRFDDAKVEAGRRYVYIVVAVDTAAPPNTSPQSNRAEETARQ
ncbi:MAG: hypothetical protein LC791_00885 [Acidobacteria bacterium]|nr:hypothetical protein [Acidobacteriota bacterium]